MDVVTGRTPRQGSRVPAWARRIVGAAVAWTLLVGVGAVAVGTIHAVRRVRRLRELGRQVPALDHGSALAGVAPVRHLAVIGDSAAAGHGLADPGEAYSRLVAEGLTARDGRATRIANVAVDGATILDVLRHQLGAVRDAEVVIIGVGVNDAIRRRPVGRVEREMEVLLRRVHARAADRPRVLFITAPDLSIAPGLPSQLRAPLGYLCRRTASAQREVASRWDVEVVGLPREVLPAEVFGEDGFHPGRAGHRRLAEGILRRLDGLVTEADYAR